MKKSLSGRRVPVSKRVRVSELLHHNTAIIPASQLKAAKEWQRKANQLPDGSTLLVLPAGNGRMEVVGRRIRFTLYRQGRTVTVTTIH
jgi:hypothetical protein